MPPLDSVGPMTPFESQLLRLKELLQVTKDREVARALGMTPAAFSYRKVQGSFPEEHLLRLNQARPDIDPVYVLFGVRRPADPEGAKPTTPDALHIARSFDRWSADAVMQDAIQHPWIQSLLMTLYCASERTLTRTMRYANELLKQDQAKGTTPRPFTERASYEQFARRHAQAAPPPSPPPAAKRARKPRAGGPS